MFPVRIRYVQDGYNTILSVLFQREGLILTPQTYEVHEKKYFCEDWVKMSMNELRPVAETVVKWLRIYIKSEMRPFLKLVVFI